MQGKLASVLPVGLSLFDSVQNGGAFVRDVTTKIGSTWKRSIRSIGGYWLGTAEWEGPASEMEDIFANSLMGRVQESVCGLVTWEGFLAEMELQLGRMKLTRSWTELINKVKVMYSRIGENLLANGSAESAAWAAYGTPTIREQSTAWVSHGTYSCHIATNAKWEGCYIHDAGGEAIAAGKSYHFQVTVKVVSGYWRVALYNMNNFSEVFDYADIPNTTDPQVIELAIADSQAWTVGIAIYQYYGTTAEIYADGAVLQEAPSRAETSWYKNAQSIADYGTHELILSQAGMSAAAAQALAETELAKRLWPRSYPPRALQDTSTKEMEKAKLKLVVYGYVFGLTKRYSIADGEDNCSSWVTNLLTGDDNITAGMIQANTQQFAISAANPMRVWDMMRQIAQSGDALDSRWTLGVYEGRKLHYLQAETGIIARLRNGRFYNSAGSLIDPWLAQPGYVFLDDMPSVVGAPTTTNIDDQKIVYMEEVEFDAAKWLKTGRGLGYRMEANR
ncbi:MAG: hypothetical protein C4575_12970 [Desulforudis sp.]|nr:MAG: hypothetical protein C4575_12970 [Desulforudis sp.]